MLTKTRELRAWRRNSRRRYKSRTVRYVLCQMARHRSLFVLSAIVLCSPGSKQMKYLQCSFELTWTLVAVSIITSILPWIVYERGSPGSVSVIVIELVIPLPYFSDEHMILQRCSHNATAAKGSTTPNSRSIYICGYGRWGWSDQFSSVWSSVCLLPGIPVSYPRIETKAHNI